MAIRIKTLVTVLALGIPVALVACVRPGGESAEVVAAPAQVKEVTVAELAAMLERGSAIAVDVNDDETRAQIGIIPSAIRPTNLRNVVAELPSDKDAALVFYCYNRR